MSFLFQLLSIIFIFEPSSLNSYVKIFRWPLATIARTYPSALKNPKAHRKHTSLCFSQKAALRVEKIIPPRGVELPHSNTGNNEKSIEGGAESGADQPETDELVDLLDSMTPEQREALIALIRTKK